MDTIGGSWGAYVLVADSGGNCEWSISVWGISITVWVVCVWGSTIEDSWVGISGSLATVSTISVASITVISVSVSSVSVSISAITVSSISKTIGMMAIVSFRGSFGFWFGNNGRKKAKGENGKFHHFEYELLSNHYRISQAIEFV